MKKVIILLAATFFSTAVLGQKKSVLTSQVFVEAGQNLTVLKLRLRDKNTNFQDTAYATCINNVARIERQLSRLYTASMDSQITPKLKTKIYDQVSNYNDLAIYASHSNSLDTLNAVIKFIRSDLSLKFTGAFGSETDNHTGLVTVTVRVFSERTGLQMPAYEPSVKPEWSIDPNQLISINPTTRASASILPGRKLFVIKKNGVKINERVVDIILGTNQPIDFYIP